MAIKEDYISFEIANLLKEKGFQQLQDNCGYFTTEMVYSINVDDNGEHHFAHQYPAGVYNKDEYIAAPTLQMAMKWLRLEHNIHIEPHIVKTKRSYGYMPNYIDLKELKQHFPFDEFDFSNADKYVSITYDKACEVTLKYCLEHLI